MQYPLTEKIGEPELFVGRNKEFRQINKWLDNIPKRLSKSRVILARRKSGKTAFVQRIFNQLWTENGMVIPFYFDIKETKVWYPTFAIDYYRTFVSQYLSFIQRDEGLAGELLSLDQIRAEGVTHSIKRLVDDVDSLKTDKERGEYDLVWKIAYSAPHRFAEQFNRRFLVILDEFQNITQFVYRDEKCEGKPDETLAGSFHYHSESKIAPMLVTGSYAGWLLKVIHQYLEAGRLKPTYFYPYLTKEEGLQVVYKYAEIYQEPITNETAVQINELCMADPFFISCVIQSDYEGKKLTETQGVINTVNYEISDDKAEMFLNWGEYLEKTLQRINGEQQSKQMLLHLNKYADRYWTPQQLKNKLHLDLSLVEIQRILVILSEVDVIDRGTSDIDFRGLQDGTLNLVLRRRFEKEIEGFVPDFPQEFSDKIKELKAENRSLRGKLNHYAGIVGEHLLATAFRSKKRFALTEFFQNVTDNTRLNIINVRERIKIQRDDGKEMELDIVALSKCGRAILVEVKKTQEKTSLNIVEDFQEKVEVYRKQFPEKIILPACLSLGGFRTDAARFCETHGIATATEIKHYL
ncbi:MAG: hypothetical protein ABFS56_00465 [Pseudomonadota bacterium]